MEVTVQHPKTPEVILFLNLLLTSNKACIFKFDLSLLPLNNGAETLKPKFHTPKFSSQYFHIFSRCTSIHKKQPWEKISFCLIIGNH